MANLKDLKRRINSVKNTKKTTYAMKLVSAAKLRRAQESVQKSREYTDALLKLLGELSREVGGGDSVHPLMEVKKHVRKARFLVVGGSRGLCGGYNSNLNKRLEQIVFEWGTTHPTAVAEFVLLGRKPAEYFRRKEKQYLKSFEQLPDEAIKWPIDDVGAELERAFLDDSVDEVFVVYTRFKSALSMNVVAERVLPLVVETSAVQTTTSTSNGKTIFEPSVEAVYAAVLPRIMRAQIRQATLDAKASEYGSRMTAMDAATKNAGELITTLTLKANKLRQSKITAELLDILGGAEAVS